tara:strand:+ start:42 stop:1559 length:1518 start_codon:yes stop_codon:yes gene_type:complete
MDNKVFITGGNSSYLPLIEVLIKSIKPHLVQSDFIVYTFDCDYEIEGIETRRINLPIFKFPPQSTYFNLAWKDNKLYWAKYYATLDAFKDYEYVSWLDGDAFVTEHINEIWSHSEQCKKTPQPLFMHYWHSDVANWVLTHGGLKIDGKYGSEGSFIFDTPRNPNNKLLAAGIYIAHSSHIQFFKDCLDLWFESHHKDCYMFVDDNGYSEERLANVLTWKNNTYGFLPITWLNYWNDQKETYFKDNKFTSFLKKETDVMVNTDTKNVLMVHGPKDAEDLNNMYKAFCTKPTKLMIVAHPDDELIFGGSVLIEDNSWRVICLTNKRDDKRRGGFEKVMRDLAIPEFEVYDLEDNLNVNLNDQELTGILNKEIHSQNWEKIATHNSIGEYGHTHHHQIHNKVKELLNNSSKFWVFDKDISYNNPQVTSKKEQIFNNRYKSQGDILNQIKTMRGDWFKDKDMTTNYIENGVIKPYNESTYKNDNFIHCTLKGPQSPTGSTGARGSQGNP